MNLERSLKFDPNAFLSTSSNVPTFASSWIVLIFFPTWLHRLQIVFLLQLANYRFTSAIVPAIRNCSAIYI
ncbi:hypothetical protein [Nostoc sp.]|uniref:hypothetical protein n=1 Tax=Nostoc sp. TaxID=1180 RepID=UPI002FFCC492